jgi:predicted transcriptional regulator
MVIDLLQAVGLTKYEAEAYYTLLREGPLTGYEVGKRSNVPLPRAYDTMDRLTERGLALVQPGDPPRYAAVEVAQVLGRVRTRVDQTLAQLTNLLADLPRPDPSGEFWVVRRLDAITDHCRTVIDRARQEVLLCAPGLEQTLSEAVERARARGCRILVPARHEQLPGAAILLAVDGREAVLGDADSNQAVVGGNRALVELIRIAVQSLTDTRVSPISHQEHQRAPEWLSWEAAKHARLHRLSTGRDAA